MSEVVKKEINGTNGDGGSKGVSPYATGGGGVTFERRVAVQYLTHLLVGDATMGVGDGRRVVSIAFQQAPEYTVDDLVVSAAYPKEKTEPSLVLALAVRRNPKIVKSNPKTQKLFLDFVHALVNASVDGPEYRFGLVVAGVQRQAEQLGILVAHAAVQMDAPSFFKLIRTPNKFSKDILERLHHMENLVKQSLADIGVAGSTEKDVQQCTWELLARLIIFMPRLESPDETDWLAVTNRLIPVARGTDTEGAEQLRDRLVSLASEYAPKAASVDLTLLRRDVHRLLELPAWRNKKGWQELELLHRQALGTVRCEVITPDGVRRLRLERNEIMSQLMGMVENAHAVVVSGESGVGKSALALLEFTKVAEEDPDKMQVLCISLRHVPKLPIEFQSILGCQLSVLLSELSASQRILIIDGADAVAEGQEEAFRYLVNAAQESDVKVVAVTAIGNKEVIKAILKECIGNQDCLEEHIVYPLTDQEIEMVVETFTELRKFNDNTQSRELLRRLVVVDLLVRSGIHGIPLSDADAMYQVWSRLVRRCEKSDRGMPDAREIALIKLADLALYNVKSSERLDSISRIDPAALGGLRRDGLLQNSDSDPFRIGPEFAHDEIRRYAVAHLLLADRAPAEKIMSAGCPRWSLSAARLACQVLLEEPSNANSQLQGRLGRLQSAFDSIVESGHGDRWGDVPGEALLTIGDPRPVLQDAWSDLRSNNAAGLRRLARLVGQRLHDNNTIVDINAVEPIIELLLDDRESWKSKKYIQKLLRDWLHAHVVAHTARGHQLRIQLRRHLMDACNAADILLAKEREDRIEALAARTPEEVEHDKRIEEERKRLLSPFRRGKRHQRPQIPSEITSAIVLELLALLGPDLGSDGEAILRRVAQNAPWHLAPAVEELFTGCALASYGKGLLAHLTEAYYFDDKQDGYGRSEDGIRRHSSRSFRPPPLSAWNRGPFYWLLRNDFRAGVKVLNRLLNHATRLRVAKLVRLHQNERSYEGGDVGSYQIELEIAGERQPYRGDDNVWYWYRGSGVGPFPCFSALQALERVCDELIKKDVPIRRVVSLLLEGSESLAMVGFVVGLLVRHLEKADSLLDSCLIEPVIWDFEFARITGEHSGLAANSAGLVAPDRRQWSFRNVAMFMVIRADQGRIIELQSLSKKLVSNERRHLKSKLKNMPVDVKDGFSDYIKQRLALVRNWASYLNRSMYRAESISGGLQISVIPPEDVGEALQQNNQDLDRGKDALRLRIRYGNNPNQISAESLTSEELESDLSTAKQLLESPPFLIAQHYWDEPALVAATALEAYFLYNINLSEKSLVFAAGIIIRVGLGEARMSSHENEFSYFQDGADRSAARSIPLLLLPAAAPLLSTVSKEFQLIASECISQAGIRLAQTISYEVRLHFARGMDHVWQTPCTEKGHCHHEVGWDFVKEMMRDCVLGNFDSQAQRHHIIKLKEPIIQSLNNTNEDSILLHRLDAAIRALAPAVTANTSVSDQAHDLLLALLHAQRRTLLFYKNTTIDMLDSHMLVAARALLTLAEHENDSPLYENINVFADTPDLLCALLLALSAAAEEAESRAATARRIWPSIICYVLALEDSGYTPFQDSSEGDRTLAVLMPDSVPESVPHEIRYLYGEIQGEPILWWDPCSMQREVEEWLIRAVGSADCVDQLIGFIGVLSIQKQVQIGIPWLAKLVIGHAEHIARGTMFLSGWLIKVRPIVIEADLLNTWQELVDALVVAGSTRLAPYSE